MLPGCCCEPPPPPPPTSPSPDDDCPCNICCAFDLTKTLTDHTVLFNLDGVTGDNCPCVNGEYELTYEPFSGTPGKWVYSGLGVGCESGEIYIEFNCSTRQVHVILLGTGCEMNYFCPVETVDPPDTVIGEWHGSGMTCVFGDENELSCSTEDATFSITVIPPP